MTLVADILQISSPIHTEDERKSISGDSYTSSGNSSSGDLNDATIVAQPKQRTPRGERNLLPCEVCGKAFDRPSLLKRHMRTHTGKSKILNVSAILPLLLLYLRFLKRLLGTCLKVYFCKYELLELDSR